MDTLYSPFEGFYRDWDDLDGVLAVCPDQEHLVNEQKCDLLIAILKNHQVTTESILENFAGRTFNLANPILVEAVQQRKSEQITNLFPCLPNRDKAQSFRDFLLDGPEPIFFKRKRFQSLAECIVDLDVRLPEARKKILAIAKGNAKEKLCCLSAPLELGLDLQNEADKHFYFKILKIYLSQHPEASSFIKSLRLDVVYDSNERYELLKSSIVHKPLLSYLTVNDYGFNLEDPVDQELLFQLIILYPLIVKGIDPENSLFMDYLNFKSPSIQRYVSSLFLAFMREWDFNQIDRKSLYLMIGPGLQSEYLSRFSAILAFLNKDFSKLCVFDDLLQKVPSLQKALTQCINDSKNKNDLLPAAFLIQWLAEKDQSTYAENLEKHNIIARLMKVNNFSLQLKLFAIVSPLLGVPNISKEKIDALL